MPEQHSPPTLDFVGSRINAFLGVTCHLHFWQNDQGLLCAIAVTQGMNRHQARVSTKSKLWRRKCSHHSCQDSNSQLFDRESGTLPTSYPSSQYMTESPAEYTVKAENHFLGYSQSLFCCRMVQRSRPMWQSVRSRSWGLPSSEERR